jgi:hypothetical protein
MDTTRDIVYRDFLLNDAGIRDNIDPDSGIGKGITGCVVDSWDDSDTDVIQFTEKKSLQDGNDAGDVFLGGNRLRMAGTLYGKSRALLFDQYWDLRRILNPVLAQRESPADKGYLPLFFSVPTNRQADYPSGAIDLRKLVMPRGKQLVWQRDQQGGEDWASLAIPWQATFVSKDPTTYAAVSQDYSLEAGGTVAGNFVNRGTYISALNILVVVGSAAGTIAIQGGGAVNFTITVPASTGNRTVRYNGFEKLVTFEENSIETLRMGSIPVDMVHPMIPEGTSAYTVTFTGVAPTAGSHMWFWEAYA